MQGKQENQRSDKGGQRLSDRKDTEWDAELEQTNANRSILGAATAVIMLVVSIAMAIRSASLGHWVSLSPGPGFFPLCLALILGTLSIIWGLRQWRGEQPDTAEPAGQTAEELEAEPPNNIKNIVAIVGSLVVLALVLEVLGFQLSMLLFLIFHLRILGHRGWMLTILLSVVGSFGLFILFTKVLSIFLPASSIPLLNNLGF